MDKKVDIKLGFSCNNRCIFCVQGNKRFKYEDKSTERIKEILKESVSKHSIVVFTGGEVTIRDDLPELVSYAKDIGFKVIQIQTNGRRFAYKSYCKTLINAGANDFGLALHGPTPEIHDSLTRAEGSFKQTTKGIQNLAELGQHVGVNCVITKPAYKKFPDLADLLIDLGAAQYQFAFIHINNIIKNDPELIKKIVPKKSDIMPYIKKGLQKGIDAGLNVMTEAIPLCFMEGYEDYVAENGKIPEGSVYDADFSIENYQDYRKNEGKAKAEKCKKCKYYKICEGPWKEYPDIFGWDEFKPIKK
ncbi:MAG: radical SAM protein [Candidatus Woesearchaeota archaeon]